LDGVFRITEETKKETGKDTSRLLAAGADRVFWLQVLRENMPEGLTALLNIIGPNAISICESNSLRKVVEPGLFLMAQAADSTNWKDSAAEVRQYADRIVVSDGKSFDLDIDRLELIDGRWTLRGDSDCADEHTIAATAVVMAGGESTRMGVDKSLLPIDGRPVIEKVCEQFRGHFDQILISANEPEKLAFLGLDVVPDRIPGQGPLMGIASALEASRSQLNFVVACDIPNIDIGLAKNMLAEAEKTGADIIIPKTSEGYIEPLFAVYRKSIIERANQILASGRRKIADIFGLCKVKYVELHDDDRLVNINTPAEYEKFRKEHGD
ncbi:MAG: molybdenum cofactor guanylyltransferase, partial [Planctomycetota bacterium]